MKNLLKVCLFLFIFAILFSIFTLVVSPNDDIKKYGYFDANNFEILGEKENTIDVFIVGDSLVYSSISPMDIWGEYGLTTFNCTGSAQKLSEAAKYIEVALKNQKPKVILLEASTLFRNAKNQHQEQRVMNKVKDLLPMTRNHNNWKNYIKYGSKDKWINPTKGFKILKKKRPAENIEYMFYSDELYPIPESNLPHLKKIIDMCNENNIELVFFSIPTLITWNYPKHNTIVKVAMENNLDFVDLNLIDLGIDWTKETRDEGLHLNYQGSKRVSSYMGNYLKEKYLIEDRRLDPDYSDWHKAYDTYQELTKKK